MNKVPARRPSIPEDLMLAQSEQMREFFIQMWLQNPELGRRAGREVEQLLAVPPAPTFMHGIHHTGGHS